MTRRKTQKIPSYKIMLIGPPGIGKTKTINRLLKEMVPESSFISNGSKHPGVGNTSFSNWQYHPTLGVEVSTFRVDGIVYNIWDCSGRTTYSVTQSTEESYYKGADHVIVIGAPGVNITRYTEKCENVPFTIIYDTKNIKDEFRKLHSRFYGIHHQN